MTKSRLEAFSNGGGPQKADDRIRRMGDEKLSLSELKKRGQAQGFTKIQRLYTSAKVPLETWTGFATERNADVYYVLSDTQVTVFKNGKVEAHYLLSC